MEISWLKQWSIDWLIDWQRPSTSYCLQSYENSIRKILSLPRPESGDGAGGVAHDEAVDDAWVDGEGLVQGKGFTHSALLPPPPPAADGRELELFRSAGCFSTFVVCTSCCSRGVWGAASSCRRPATTIFGSWFSDYKHIHTQILSSRPSVDWPIQTLNKPFTP